MIYGAPGTACGCRLTAALPIGSMQLELYIILRGLSLLLLSPAHLRSCSICAVRAQSSLRALEALVALAIDAGLPAHLPG